MLRTLLLMLDSGTIVIHGFSASNREGEPPARREPSGQVHILPPQEAMGLLPKKETIQVERVRGGIEMDLVTHDILKFFLMLLKRNGYVLEQLYSPLIVQGGQGHDELKEIARGCVTRHHSHHYLGFAATQWELFRKEDPPRIKPLTA